MRSRSSTEKGTVTNARVRGGSGEKSTSAASAPSRLVPDISPTKSDTLFEAGRRCRADQFDRGACARRERVELRAQVRGHRLGLGKRDAHRVLMHPGDL